MNVAREEAGQASIEAALMLPVMMLLLAMLVQPACLLYTRCVMQQAATETTRALISRTGSGAISDESYRAYALRRLHAVPNVAAFHTGGLDGWTITCSGDESTQEVSVKIEGALRPLPFLGVMAYLLGEVRGDEVVLSVEATQKVQPEWVGGTYSTWMQVWE